VAQDNTPDNHALPEMLCALDNGTLVHNDSPSDAKIMIQPEVRASQSEQDIKLLDTVEHGQRNFW